MNRQCNRQQIINSVFLRCMYILIMCLVSVGIYGQQQTYPVQVYTQLAPPYTPHIPAYYTGTQAKLKVMLINTDMQQPTVNVYLRMKILSSSFSAVTPPEVYTPQIELQAGMLVTLSLNDLEPYFKKENLRVSGGQSEFYRTQMLPDNFYRFHFEVYEVGTNRLVSNTKTGFAQAMIASGEPPILNLPQKGSVIKESNIPSIMFSWTPKHMNSIAAAYGTEYDISLVEIYDKQVAPEAAFDYSRVLYTETTKSTSFIHTVAQPLLIPGMRYAWRVQAKAREGVDEISVFKNNGYSPVSWFDYTADCKTVQSCGAIYENGHVDISWQDAGAMEYTVEYRKKGTSRWYTGTINKPLLSQLYNLQAGKDYEYRIGSRCVAGDAFQYNDLQAFHIPDRQENGPNCGLMPDISLTNRTPARELQSGMPVLVGDFPVFITKVSGSGRFTGEGYVGIPYLQGAQIAVTFKDIVVNTDNRLVEGFFETKNDTKNNNLLFDADQYQTGGKGVGDIRSGEEQAAFKVDYTINPDIKALPLKADGTKDEIKEGTDYTISKGENGKYTFILTDSEGKEHKVEADTMPATIEDKEGNTYEVNEKGEVKPVSKVSDIKLDSSTKDTQSKLGTLSFKATKNTKYALDEYNSIYEKVTEYNDQYKPEGTAITASAKFMLPGASDEIAVYIKENKDNKLIPEKVRFVTGKGREYPATYDNQTKEWTLTIVGGQANDGQELYAVQDTGDDKYETLGKLNIFTYEPFNRSVTLVPVNGAMNGLDKQTVQNGLNEIYGKVGIHWTVNVLEKPFSYTPKNGSTFNVTGSGLLSMFTDDMKAINEAFKQSGEYQEDGLYLFVIGDKASESGTEGDMPLGSQFGYLFPNASIRTIAHEVGHGAFNLEHPFDRPVRNSFPQKGMLEYNLMDYPTKDAEKWTELVKLQWDQTRAPGHVIGLFQKDKSGMSMGMLAQETESSQQIDNPGDEISFYIGNKKYTFIFRDKIQNLTNSQFNSNNKIFVVASYVKDGTFAGFYEKSEYQKLQDKDGKVDLSSNTIKSLQQFKAYELKDVEELSSRSVELKDALIENNNYGKVKAIIVLSQAISNDEYQSVFSAASRDNDCRIELGTKKAYADACLDKYIDALVGALNKEVEYFDRNCNCIVKRSGSELLGNSDPDFQKWFTDSIGGADAIRILENRIYEANIARYTDNIAKGIYGADKYGTVNIPQSIKEKVRREARESAFPAIKAMWAIERSGADPDGLFFNFSSVSFERFSYYYYRALTTTSNEDAKEILTDVGLQVAIQWAFEVIPAVKTAKGNLAKWTEAKVKPADLISEIEGKGYYIIDGNEEAIILKNGSNQEGKVSITARNLDNVQWLNITDDLLSQMKVKGYSLFDEVDGFIIFKDASGQVGKISSKAANLDGITWFKPKAGNTWQIHEENVTNYLKFKYGNKVSTQVKVQIYHKNGQAVEGYLDDLVETSNKDLLIIDAKHSQKAAIVDGKIPGYTAGQKQSYQWITDGDVVKIEIIGDGANNIPGLGRKIDILPRLKGKVGIITNDASGQLVEISVYKTTK
ncbi:hypothetical protein [Dysgonomonas termitidis]|uniref:Fibronectin type-III domain-containing protein n=1 Tax=Dysgonomonas termitidis TaxID=1516126 RepID=A0ABV9KSV0_9BACT